MNYVIRPRLQSKCPQKIFPTLQKMLKIFIQPPQSLKKLSYNVSVILITPPCLPILRIWLIIKSGRSFIDLCESLHFLPAETINGMVVDHADCLHEGVTDGGTYKS